MMNKVCGYQSKKTKVNTELCAHTYKLAILKGFYFLNSVKMIYNFKFQPFLEVV